MPLSEIGERLLFCEIETYAAKGALIEKIKEQKQVFSNIIYMFKRGSYAG
jgi:hypothetical protein